MKSVGIREAKARLSHLARAAAKGEVTILTDYGTPVAVIGPIELTTSDESASDAGEFREGLAVAPLSPGSGFLELPTYPSERNALMTWLIDTALFATLGPASSQKSGLRHWLGTHREPVFLSAASIVEIEATIGRVPASQQPRINALRDWLDGLLSAFSDRIHPVDIAVAVRAGRLLPHCHIGLARHRFHDAVLAATAQTHGHGLLTRRDAVFGAWTKVAVASP